MISHRTALSLLLGLTALSSCDPKEKSPPQEPRNVLLITLDTTRADYLSVNGFHRETSPRLDELAAGGVNFTRAMSSSAVTPVSHATILTGRFPDKHGLRVLAARGGFRLPKDVSALPQVLKERGYRTAAIHSAFPVSKIFGFSRGFDYFDSVEATFMKQQKRNTAGEVVDDENSQKVGWDVKKFQRRSDATTNKALAWLEGRKADDAPWFLWLHYWDPHDGKKQPPRDFIDPSVISMTQRGRYTSGYDEFYAEEIRYMDGQIGRVFDALRSSGEFDKTITVLTADHGEGLYDGLDDHGWRAHRELYRQQINVPLILHLPDHPEAAGNVVDTLVRTADVYPTILESLGIHSRGEIDGASLLPLTSGAEDASPRIHYAEQINGYDFNASMIDSREIADFIYSVMDDEWKLIYRPNHPEASELFHHKMDRGEKNDLWDQEPEQRLRLLRELALRESWVTQAFPKIHLSAEEQAGMETALGQLGYTGQEGEEGEPIEHYDDEPVYSWAWTCPGEEEVLFDEPGWCEAADCPRILVKKPRR